VCSECGRIFQIPNLPQYTQAFLYSIRSRSVAHFGVGLGIEKILNTTVEEISKETHWEITTAERYKSPKIKVSIFPERGEPQILAEKNWLWVIAEYPGHYSLEQIQRVVVNEILVLESRLPLCPYKDIIEGLGVFIKIFEENLRNGILEIKLKEK